MNWFLQQKKLPVILFLNILKSLNIPDKSYQTISQILPSFYFSCVEKSSIFNQIGNLDLNRATQNTEMFVKIIAGNSEFFAESL